MIESIRSFLVQIFSAVAIIVLLLSSNVSALPNTEIRSLHLNSVHYLEADNTSSSQCSEADIVLTGSGNAKKAYNFFISQGFTPHQAAGIVGNLIAESGVIPNRKQGEGIQTIKSASEIVPDTGFGIAQWTSGGRQQNWLRFAEDKNADPLSLELELQFLMHELNTNPSLGLAELKKASDVRQAAWVFLVFFERPAATSGFEENPRQATSGTAKAELDVREKLAQGVLGGGNSTDTSGSTSSPSSGNSCSTGGGSGDGEIVSADGYTFPLKASRNTILQGAAGSKWCYKATSNCHHDYNAADIFAPTGTPVVAMRGGQVKSAKDHDSSSVGSRVTIMGDDGRLYYYAHMGDGTIKVRNGQTISAGTHIGNVGTSADAVGTDPHLHIDSLPGNKYTYRPECSGASCSSYPFHNIQAILAEVFKSVK